MSDYLISRIAKLMVNAKTRTLINKIVEQAMAERTKDIMITLQDAGEDSAAEMIQANW